MGEMLLNGRLYGASGIRELTQAQYDALPASKLTDGILYCIKDTGIVEGDKYAPVIYSLEEREVGVWTDGKPLYEKTFRLTTYMVVTNHSWIISFTDLGLSNIDHAFYTEAKEIRANGTVMDLLYKDPQYSDSAILRVSPQNSNLSYYTTLNGDNIRYLEFTLRYTKTTDIPGSGTWGTDGVPMVHYDGNEKIIGTWFGETLYEKTVPFNFTAGVSNWTLFDDSISYDSIVRVVSKLLANNGDQIICYQDRATEPRFCVKTDHKLYYYTTVALSGYVTLQYTKTS